MGDSRKHLEQTGRPETLGRIGRAIDALTDGETVLAISILQDLQIDLAGEAFSDADGSDSTRG
jgi:hypothetical protein